MPKKKYEILFDDDVENFIFKLKKETIAKVLRTIDLLEKFGYNLGMPHSKKIKGKIFELRIRGKIEVRIFYIFDKTKIILLHCFIKKSQKIPKKELSKAWMKCKELDNK